MRMGSGAAGPLIAKIKRLRPRPGDVLVIRSDTITKSMYEAISQGLAQGGHNGIVVIPLGLDEDIEKLDGVKARAVFEALKIQQEGLR
jgi:hypothetical protein